MLIRRKSYKLEYSGKMFASLENFSTALSPDLLPSSPSTSSAIQTPDPSTSLVKTEQRPLTTKEKEKKTKGT
jgi:hypothetical protein